MLLRKNKKAPPVGASTLSLGGKYVVFAGFARAFRPRTCIEAGVILTGVTTLSWCLPERWLAWPFVFFTFALAVLVMALRYEPPATYCTGALAALSYTCYCWFHSEISIYPVLPVLIVDGSILLLIATFTSDVLHTRLQDLQALEQQYGEISADLRKARRQKETLHILYTDLERQVEEQNKLVTALSEQLDQLWHIRGVHRFTAILRMLTHVIMPTSGALYLRHGSEMRLCTEHHLRADQRTSYAPALNIHDPLIANVIGKGQVNTVRNEATTGEPSQMGLAGNMIGPLKNNKGKIVGIVLMSGMPMPRLTPGQVQLFSALLQLAAHTIDEYELPAPPPSRDYPPNANVEEDTDPALPAIKKTQIEV